MKKLWQLPWGLVWLLALALMPEPAFAVDNTLLVTPCASGCITTKSKDIGSGVQAPQPIISDTSGNPIYGTAGTANTNVLTVQGIAAMTPIIVNQGTSPWVVSTTQWGGGTLGAMANYGTSPGAVLVPGVNSFITNVPAVSQSGTWNVTNVSGAVSLPTGAATAANQSTEITALGTPSDAAYSGSGNCTLISCLKGNYNGVTGSIGAGGNIIGIVGINQTTFGTTNGVVNAANTYNTIAASQTAQVMSATQAGGTGATGDFLSHCVVTPGTTSPGVVTVLDNATAIISFAGGASSVSNLVPFALPVAAKSTSGAWKITTGANVTVACVGKFS